MKKPRKTKRNLCFAGLIICIIKIIFLKELYIINYWDTIANYYSNEGDALPSAEDPSFAPQMNSIFFHETSYHGELSAQQACSVEAAARAHPKRMIYVLFSSPVTDYTLKTSCLAKLLQFPNVKFLRVHIVEYSKGTVVQSILLNDLKESRFPIQHTADILRMLTLNKWGGVCLDTDMIVVKPLEPLPPNWIVKQGGKFVAPGILSFGKNEAGSNITSSILEEIFTTYNTNDWSITGQRAIQKVIQRMCPIKIRWDSCRDIAIYPQELFYSTDYMSWTSNYKESHYQPSFSFRMWNFLSANRSIIQQKSYEMLARKCCPSIFGLYREELGV